MLLQDYLYHKKTAALLMTICAMVAVFFSCSKTALASGYEFDGVGARNVARGGAVIADAQDWTAVYWNPAAMAGAERQTGLELRGGGMKSKDSNSMNVPGIGNPFNKTENSTTFLFGALGAVVPLEGNAALGFGIYTPLMQGANFKDDAVVPFNAVLKSMDYDSYTLLAVANISYARKFGDKLSAGLGADIICGQLKTKAVTNINNLSLLNPLLPALSDEQTVKLDGTGYGLEGVFGLKYELNSEFALGAVFRTGSKFAVKGRATGVSAITAIFPDEKTDFHTLVKHPATSGIGVAWKTTEKLKLSLDFAQTWWRGFSNELTFDSPGAMLANKPDSFNWKNSYKIRAGVLWNVTDKTDLMCGYAYDTPAIDDASIDFSTAIDVPMHRFSAGISRQFGKIKATLAALAGSGTRKDGDISYSLGGYYAMTEVTYAF